MRLSLLWELHAYFTITWIGISRSPCRSSKLRGWLSMDLYCELSCLLENPWVLIICYTVFPPHLHESLTIFLVPSFFSEQMVKELKLTTLQICCVPNLLNFVTLNYGHLKVKCQAQLGSKPLKLEFSQWSAQTVLPPSVLPKKGLALWADHLRCLNVWFIGLPFVSIKVKRTKIARILLVM